MTTPVNQSQLFSLRILLAAASIFLVSAAIPTQSWSQASTSSSGFSHATALAQPEEGILDPVRFGAKGDGLSDDTAPLNATYTTARKTGRPVFLHGYRFRVTGRVDARGVSTIGEGATLVFQLNSKTSPQAFTWGGSDTFVTEVTFDLSNTGPDTMQGILNSVSNATNQRFYRNRVVSHTTDQTNIKSNIFGLWFVGTGLTGLYIESNQFERTSYGIQVNNQEGMTGNVRTAPLGAPSQHIHITGNTLIDATIGVNTPHLAVSDVVIEGNTISPQAYRLDLPLNVAHVSKLVISGNSITSNADSSNGTLHVEDASGAVAITGNIVTVNGENNGIEIGSKPSVSKDIAPTTRVTVTGNHIEGPGVRGKVIGILLPDMGTIDTTIGNNYVARFAQGIVAVDASNLDGNTIVGCAIPVKGANSRVANNSIRD